MPSSRKPGQLRISADLYKGMPQAKIKDQTGGSVELQPVVELKKDEHFSVKLDMSPGLANRLAGSVQTGKISITLPPLDVDLQHNQSFGMVDASTGCISNPGGPSC